MNQSFIALGSNLQQPYQQLTQAVEHIRQLGNIVAVSPFYQSTAIGPGSQPDYLNAVLQLETSLEPEALLQALQAIEAAQGRVRSITNAARTLDLDILLFNQQVLNSTHLTLPHPRMLIRNFVIYPLYDIAPNLCLPDGKTVAYYQHSLSPQGLSKYTP